MFQSKYPQVGTLVNE
ncbi:unnamed protein product [Kuraishia capsulata CBS 1993]|uniref:Uncharacterized protein n=1 Tax=Kuraishia capsulata CBS 1993 TaxID=1382522 RepID=W6MGP4_9ASCO|nr:unnamed protein product [Kuraishia capsulata CBS 1993]